MTCAWCRGPIPAEARRDSVYCCKRCRQAAWRFGQDAASRARTDQPLRLAYADPPYPGLARRYYADHPDYAGEVDHRALLDRLAGRGLWHGRPYDGWALSTSARALPVVLGLVAELGLEVRVAAWVRGARTVRSRWPASAWEPVVYAGGRQLLEEESSRLEARRVAEDLADASPAGRTDALVHRAHARTTDPGRVIGAKPAAFAWWLFDLLGALPGDHLDDLFPGSGGIGRAWEVYTSRSTSGDVSRPGPRDAFPPAPFDASPRGRGDASQPGPLDASRAAQPDASQEYSPDASSIPRGDGSVSAEGDASCSTCTTDRSPA